MTGTGSIRELLESIRYRIRLHAAASLHFEQRYYGELTPSAIRKLKKLERRAVALALGLFAYDVHRTTAQIVGMHQVGDDAKVLEEKEALVARTLAKWALGQTGFSSSSSLCELADPLGIGLGNELQAWLLSRDSNPRDAVSWLLRFGPRIERFIEYVERLPAPPTK